MQRPNIPRRPGLLDSLMSSALGMYFAWPFWTLHGGPKSPPDLGTIVLAVIGLYGTQKAFNTNKETETNAAEQRADDKKGGTG